MRNRTVQASRFPGTKSVTRDRFVFHYTRKETALEAILANRTLRLGPLKLTNDPRETQSWNFHLCRSGNPVPADSEQLNKLKELSRSIRTGCRVLCVSLDDQKQPTLADKLCWDGESESCWNRGFALPTMWAHYGGNHTGACLILNKSAVDRQLSRIANKEDIFAGEITYRTDDRREKRAFAIEERDLQDPLLGDNLRRLHYKTFFLRKARPWRAEHEFRWLVLGTGDDPIYLPLQDILAGIVVGMTFHDTYMPALKAAALRRPIGKMQWSNGRPFLRRIN